MKKLLFTSLACTLMPLTLWADGWPANYGGVMLQGFYWDSFSDTRWTKLEAQADELSQYFSLIWVPQSGKCLNSGSMGYDPYYYFDQNSAFGTATELKSMIKTFKSKGIGTIADVVVNHHNTDGWFTFPAETWQGATYQLLSTDIVHNDDGGKTLTQATTDGVSLSANDDEGQDWNGCRDLDHKSANVQTVVKAYERFLVEEMGYIGFRYDMVKGFNGSHVADYNDAAGIEYSVGECWDGTGTIRNWIDATSKKSAAFDFPFRYTVRNAANNNNWAALGQQNGSDWPLVSNSYESGQYRQYAVTFVENHDTQYRSASEPLDPIKQNVAAANAYLLAMPGTPCVFLSHWLDYKQEIKAMIDARKAAGITNTSTYSNETSSSLDYINVVKGSKADLSVRLCSYSPFPDDTKTDRVLILSGEHYAYYLSKKAEIPFVDKASGEYEAAFQAMLTAVSETADAQLVYTTDGSTPTATHGTRVASGTKIDISADCTLTVGLLVGGAITATTQRTYTISQFQPYSFTVYVNADKAGSAWSAAASTAASPYVNFWTWGGDGTHAPTNTSWPGDKETTTATTADGKKWITRTYTMNSNKDYVNFVFSVGTGSPQTVDVNYVTRDSYLEISSTLSGNKYTVDDVSSTYTTGISSPLTATPAKHHEGIYAPDGRKVRDGNTTEGLPRGLYIVNGKKVVVQ